MSPLLIDTEFYSEADYSGAMVIQTLSLRIFLKKLSSLLHVYDPPVVQYFPSFYSVCCPQLKMNRG